MRTLAGDVCGVVAGAGEWELSMKSPAFIARQKKIDDALRLLHSATPPGMELTQQEIAQACGCSRSFIDQIEKRAIFKMRDKMRKALGMSWRDFIQEGA